jgi:FkbM family methyltransferase
MHYIFLYILKLFDFFYQKKIFSFLKKKNLKNINIFFDIGAHEGESIEIFSKNFNIKKIYSFEPSPINFLKLKNKVNSFSKKFKDLEIYIENFGLGREKKKICLKQLNESSSSTINQINKNSRYFKKKKFFLNKLHVKNFYKNIDVQIVRLDEYLNNNSIEHINFMKIDTEGYELDVLQGLGTKIYNVQYIMFEHHYHDMLVKTYKFSDINELLIKNNFKKIFKAKMPFRKTFEYIYENRNQ